MKTLQKQKIGQDQTTGSRHIDRSPGIQNRGSTSIQLQSPPDERENFAQLKRHRDSLNHDSNAAVQRVEEELPEEKHQAASATAVQRKQADAPTANRGGLPSQLKAGIESLSGMSMDHVKVHYNSAQPAQLHAHAYAQGSEIHVAPGQEKHLPHEAWHVVQQAQGRVRPTMQMKGGVPVNDDPGLEEEADVMGSKALASVQRMDSGNGAAVHSPRGSSIMQYKTLDKAINIDAVGLYKTPYTFPVIGQYQHPDAELYGEVIPGKAPDRTGAMAAIATRAGQIGARVRAQAGNVVKHDAEPLMGRYKANPGAYFYSSERRGQDDQPAIDPFTHGSYCAIQGGKYLVLMYQHTYDLDGYITGVEDGTSEREGEYVRRVAGSMRYGDQHADPHSDVKYEQLHAKTGTANLNDLANAGDRPQNFDAVTKLAGEGARFQWVARNITTMTDDTMFVAPKSGAIPELTITFSNLWAVWKNWFKGQYNISDDQIVEVMHRKWTAQPRASKETLKRIKPRG